MFNKIRQGDCTMKVRWSAFKLFSLLFGVLASVALADDIPKNVSFTTRAITPFAIEGLTMDATGNFYTTGRQTDPTKKCPVWRISRTGSSRVSVGFIPNQANNLPTSAPCN